jgi:uncharacterized membrane protein YphA (DoxX/SURF4 family)
MRILFLLGVLIGLPRFASAHVKWLLPAGAPIPEATPYRLMDMPVLIWIGIIVFALIIGYLLDRRIRVPDWLTAFSARYQSLFSSLFQIISGLYFLFISFLWNVVLSPELVVTNLYATFGWWVQIVLGVILLTTKAPRLAAFMLAALLVAFTPLLGVEGVLEQAILIGVVFVLWTLPRWNQEVRSAWAIAMLRIMAGVSLVAMGFTEKILEPELSLAFLSLHHWNFMSVFGFSDSLFVLSTGFAEVLFGLLLITGFVTRITTIALALFFMLSVTSMAIGSGVWEAEDLIIYAAALTLVMYGRGVTWRQLLSRGARS